MTTAARRQRASLHDTAHRPWPLPTPPWVMGQTWEDLLFAHWRVPADRLRALLPAGLCVDTYGGEAWLGVTPLVLSGLHPRGLPPLPGPSRFCETNVRTYVSVDGRPGILFFSLDAGSALAVLGARLTYGLPYFRAAFRRRAAGGATSYLLRRLAGPAARLSVEYRPVGPARPAARGTLEHFLTERYCLYATPRGRLVRADIHHAPWPLQPARADFAANTMAPAALGPLRGEPLLHYASRQDVLVWAPVPVRDGRR